MNLKNRLAKLEKKTKTNAIFLLMVPTVDNYWTPEQLQQMNEARAEGHLILRINPMEAKKNVSD